MFYRLNKHAKSITSAAREHVTAGTDHIIFSPSVTGIQSPLERKVKCWMEAPTSCLLRALLWTGSSIILPQYLKHCKEWWSRCPHSLQLRLWVSFPYWYVCLDNLESNFLPFFAMYHFFASCDNSLNFPPLLFWNNLIEIVIKLWPAKFYTFLTHPFYLKHLVC